MDCSRSNGQLNEDYCSLASSRSEFSKKCRRISIKNMPPGITNQDISDLLKPYHYQQIHIDKMSLSCKAVLLDGESACRCVKDLNMKPCRGSRLIVTLASCDFMLCVTQLPENYTREQFLTLITPFGTPERCFLVHSETNGKSKGYGCVEYTSKESSIKAKNHLNGKAVGSCTVQVHWLDTIPQLYSGLQSSCLFVENLSNAYKDSKLLRELFSCNKTKPIYCQNANCTVDDFSVIEYSTPFDAELIWLIMNGRVIDGKPLRVTFCVPGPCGLVILNSLKASRDLKRNNPNGGLLPTPIQKLDPLQFPGKQGVNPVPPMLPMFGGPLAQAASNNDPEVQRLLRALQARLLNIPDPPSFHPSQDIKVNSNGQSQIGRPLVADVRPNGVEVQGNGLLCNPPLILPQPRGRSASYDSGVHAADDEVFSSGSSSQEDIGRPQDTKESVMHLRPAHCKNGPSKSRLDGHFQCDYPSAFSQISSMNDPNRGFSSQPQAVLACQKEDLQRSDSADSAYGGSQESAGVLPEQQNPHMNITSFHYPPPSNMGDFNHTKPMTQPPQNAAEGFPMPLPRRAGEIAKENRNYTCTNGMPRPEFLFSSLCKHEDLPVKGKDLSTSCQVLGAAFTQHRSHLARTPLQDFTSPCIQRKSFSSLMADLHDIGADSPTQLQLLGSSLMEGLLADSPRSSIDQCADSATGRLIRALNLFSPNDSLNSPHTPVAMKKRFGGMLPSPEPSPEAGAYVGQHSQGLGGHYAGPLFGCFNMKRRKSNET